MSDASVGALCSRRKRVYNARQGGRQPHTQPFLASATMLSVERQKVITMARIADVLPLLLLNPRYLEGGPSAAACLRARARDKGFSFSIYLSVYLSIYVCHPYTYIHIGVYTGGGGEAESGRGGEA